MNYPTPKFIVVDGPDGTGKTTLVRNLSNRLIEAGWPAVPARNPAGTKLGAAIRKATIEVAPEEEPATLSQFYAQVAATTQLVHEQLVPNIRDGFVIFDRYLLSLAVYQGLMPKVSLLDFIPRYAACTAHLPVPGLTVVLRSSTTVIQERIAKRNGATAAPKSRGRKAAAPAADLMETEERINAQVLGFEYVKCFLPPDANFVQLDVDTRDEAKVLELVWSVVQRIWPTDLAGTGSDNLQKSREAISKFG